MIDVKDRIQANPNRIKLTEVSAMSDTYDYELVGEVTEAGTNINRVLLMALQGFEPVSFEFTSYGAIITNTQSNLSCICEIKNNGITEFFNNSITKTTTKTGDKYEAVIS